MSKAKFKISNRGTSLIEILVVMIVLLVGIMTVIRVFPIGFGVVRSAESQTIATRLAQRELERWKNMPASLPDGIVPIEVVPDPSDSRLTKDVVLNDQYPGPPFESWVDNGSGGYDRGNLLNLRKVINESTAIPVASYFTTGAGSVYGSRYTLAFGPIDAKIIVDGDDILVDGLTVKGGDLRRRVASSDNDPPYLKRGQYAIDYGDGSPTFYIAFPREGREMVYYITYSYWEEESGSPVLRTVLDESVFVPAAYDGSWTDVPVTLSGSGTFIEMESNTDTCARGFRAVKSLEAGVDPNFDPNDPYQYVLADSLCGVVAFNPVGHDSYEYTAQGMRPLIARISYRIYDMRIMREDRVLPDAQDDKITVKMSLPFILDAGAPGDDGDGTPTDNPNEETFEGLTPDIALSVLAIDLATGFRLDENALDIDFDRGAVTIPDPIDFYDYYGNMVAEDVPMVGRHVRFFYRADGDWTLSPQKAYSRYVRESDTGTVDYRHFKLSTPAGGSFASRLLFGQCDAGKTVSVDYISIDSAGVEHKVVGESHRISDDTVGVNCYIDLTPPADTQAIKNVVVVGTSFKARVVWRDSRHWRHVDLETSLMRDRNKL